MTGDLSAQTQPANTTDLLKALSLEELGNLVVTSVSRRPEELSTVASAIQVITQDDIRRSGATRLPEVLRLATNLEVAQLDSSQWAISARGFNSPLANKLLVLIDGRTVYSPLFAGVFWDAQDVVLEDIDRIEVISGPGATLWGANAVNGVINITTKSARETQGLFLEGGGGTELQGFGTVRYGVPITPDASFRIYGKSAARDSMELGSGVDAANAWRIRQGGFRLDWDRSDANTFTFQGDLYQDYNVSPKPSDPRTSGGNVIGRWSHTFSPASDLTLQLYADRIHKISPGSYDDVLATYDADFQHRLPTVRQHVVVWGASYRLIKDDFGPGSLAFVPRRLTQHTFSAFAQDEIALAPDRLVLTLGTKIQRDAYTGLELQPSVRLAWTSSARHTLWTSISRAVRTPSRLDRDLIVLPFSAGGPDSNRKNCWPTRSDTVHGSTSDSLLPSRPTTTTTTRSAARNRHSRRRRFRRCSPTGRRANRTGWS
jgi:iron complex outermembrane recepter protein